MNASEYDFAIIGAGSAGLIAADFAVKLGARVVMLEKDRIGGDCTWTGCVPSKSLIKAAKVAHSIGQAARYGIHCSEPRIAMPEVHAYLNAAIDRIYAGTTPEALRAKGMEIALGPVRFVDAHTLACGERRICARKMLIATGAHPVIPPIQGLATVPFSTYHDFFDSDELPQTMAIVGGGPIGAELGQAYQRLGVQVTIIAERLLAKEEPEVSALMERVLEREGVRMVRARTSLVERAGRAVRVHAADATIEAEKLLVATGRAPMIAGLQLKAAGVEYNENGIEVDPYLRTTARNIYAAGDVTGAEQFSHMAGWQGFQAARNALLPGSNHGFSPVVPRVTFTDPEVAQVGTLEKEARSRGMRDLQVGCWSIDKVDRAVCEDDHDGLIKIVARSNGAILGATIVGLHAGEAIMELTIAMAKKIKVQDLAGIIHPYPTYCSGVQLLATEMAMRRAMTGTSGRLVRALSRWARR